MRERRHNFPQRNKEKFHFLLIRWWWVGLRQEHQTDKHNETLPLYHSLFRDVWIVRFILASALILTTARKTLQSKSGSLLSFPSRPIWLKRNTYLSRTAQYPHTRYSQLLLLFYLCCDCLQSCTVAAEPFISFLFFFFCVESTLFLVY